MESPLLCATKDGVNKAEKRGQERGEEGMGGVGEGKRSRGTGSKREEQKTEGEKRRGRGTKSNKLKTGSNLGSRGKHPTTPDHTLVSDPGIWAKKEMGALPASRGTQGTKAVLTALGHSMEQWAEGPRRDLDIRTAYLVLEGAAVTLEECVVFSGVAVSVDVLIVVAVVGLAVIMVVMLIIVVVLIVVVMVADTNRHRIGHSEGQRLRGSSQGSWNTLGFPLPVAQLP